MDFFYGTYKVIDSRNNHDAIVLVTLSEQRGQPTLTLHDYTPGKQILYGEDNISCLENKNIAPSVSSIHCHFAYEPSYQSQETCIAERAHHTNADIPPCAIYHGDQQPFSVPFRRYPREYPLQPSGFDMLYADNTVITDREKLRDPFTPIKVHNAYYLKVQGKGAPLHLVLKKI
ncbi:MAG: hypothetical protein IT497_01730 [Ottowia sp.]|nr:hypothetical protein [Ottowia sp.]